MKLYVAVYIASIGRELHVLKNSHYKISFSTTNWKTNTCIIAQSIWHYIISFSPYYKTTLALVDAVPGSLPYVCTICTYDPWTPKNKIRVRVGGEAENEANTLVGRGTHIMSFHSPDWRWVWFCVQVSQQHFNPIELGHVPPYLHHWSTVTHWISTHQK